MPFRSPPAYATCCDPGLRQLLAAPSSYAERPACKFDVGGSLIRKLLKSRGGRAGRACRLLPDGFTSMAVATKAHHAGFVRQAYKQL